jgi:AAA15 family ATPase/GTPase
MLQSLAIKNYRNLVDLKISALAQVNLVTGKNNTGKSTLLEAISLISNSGDLSWIFGLLDDRGENYRLIQESKNFVETNIKSLQSLFTGRKAGFRIDDAIQIGSLENTLFGEERSDRLFVSLRFVRYVDELITELDKGVPISQKRRIVEDADINKFLHFQIGLEVRTGKGSFIYPLDEDRPYRFGFRNADMQNNSQFIRTRNIDRAVNGKLWDNIALTEMEDFVVDALRIIEPGIEKIAFIGNDANSRSRTTVIRLKNSSEVIPLKSMGDGINRILTIILALVNSDNGFLLIDEFENGLHHSVQEKLWEIIFKLSQDLNVQVFATTHSEDCITGFSNVLNSKDNSHKGKLIRLDNIDEKIIQVEYAAEELRIATSQNIETR